MGLGEDVTGTHALSVESGPIFIHFRLTFVSCQSQIVVRYGCLQRTPPVHVKAFYHALDMLAFTSSLSRKITVLHIQDLVSFFSFPTIAPGRREKFQIFTPITQELIAIFHRLVIQFMLNLRKSMEQGLLKLLLNSGIKVKHIIMHDFRVHVRTCIYRNFPCISRIRV